MTVQFGAYDVDDIYRYYERYVRSTDDDLRQPLFSGHVADSLAQKFNFPNDEGKEELPQVKIESENDPNRLELN